MTNYKHENAEVPISQEAYELYFKMRKKYDWTKINDKLYWEEG